jgi:hypothetical protein
MIGNDILVNNKIIVFAIIGILFMGTVVTQAIAAPNENENSKAKEMTVVSIPENAKKIGDGVYDLGYKVHDGQILQGTLYVFSDKEFAKPDGTPGNGNGGGGTTTCYSYISKGAKWKAEEPWTVDTTDAPSGINVVGILGSAADHWEDADNPNNAIMGNYDSSLTVDRDSIGISMNDQNEVIFGDIAGDSTIAATWVFSTLGSPSQRSIVEWDQVYDVGSFSWSDSGDSGSMDFENIAAHEIGHAVGMGHPSSTCTLETMYAYADNGEIIKRDLHDGDIAGVNLLY